MGATCVGKSTLAKELSEESGAYCYSMDDFKLFMQMVVTDKMDKALVNALNASAFLEKKTMETLVSEGIAVKQLFSYAIESVIAHHFHQKTKLIVEGSYILPYLGVKKTIMNQSVSNKIIKSIFIVEDDDKFTIDNIIKRDKERGTNNGFSETSKREQEIMSEWVKKERDYLLAEAQKHNIDIIESRPFSTLGQRAREVLRR